MCVKCNMCNKRNKLLKGRIVEKLNYDSLIFIKQPDDPLPVKGAGYCSRIGELWYPEEMKKL